MSAIAVSVDELLGVSASVGFSPSSPEGKIELPHRSSTFLEGELLPNKGL